MFALLCDDVSLPQIERELDERWVQDERLCSVTSGPKAPCTGREVGHPRVRGKKQCKDALVKDVKSVAKTLVRGSGIIALSKRPFGDGVRLIKIENYEGSFKMPMTCLTRAIATQIGMN